MVQDIREVEAPTLYPEMRDDPGLPEKGKHGYYRKADGWVCVSSTTPTNKGHFEYKGFSYLGDYGDFGLGTRGGKPKEVDQRGVPWNPADEQWRLIFQKGGAKEFPPEQIIAFRWHLTPPYREITFPQLDGVEVFDLPCPECKAVFSSLVEQQTVFNLRAHLTSRMSDTHSYSVTDLTELGKEWDINFQTARTRRELPSAVGLEAAPVPEESPEPAPGEQQPEMSTKFACKFGCGWAPRAGIAASRQKGAQTIHHKGCAQNPDVVQPEQAEEALQPEQAEEVPALA